MAATAEHFAFAYPEPRTGRGVASGPRAREHARGAKPLQRPRRRPSTAIRSARHARGPLRRHVAWGSAGAAMASLRDLKAYGEYDAEAAEERLELARTASRESKRREEAAAKEQPSAEKRRQEDLRRKQWREDHPEEVMAARVAQRVVRRAVTDMAHKTMWSMNLLCCRVASRGCDPPTPRAKPVWDAKAEGSGLRDRTVAQESEVDWNSNYRTSSGHCSGTGAAWAAPRKCVCICSIAWSGGRARARIRRLELDDAVRILVLGANTS